MQIYLSKYHSIIVAKMYLNNGNGTVTRTSSSRNDLVEVISDRHQNPFGTSFVFYFIFLQ